MGDRGKHIGLRTRAKAAASPALPEADTEGNVPAVALPSGDTISNIVIQSDNLPSDHPRRAESGRDAVGAGSGSSRYPAAFA